MIKRIKEPVGGIWLVGKQWHGWSFFIVLPN